MAPEIKRKILNKDYSKVQYTNKIDIYSLGASIYHLVMGSFPSDKIIYKIAQA